MTALAQAVVLALPLVGPRRSAAMDFLDVTIGPDGTAWAPFVDACDGPVCLARADTPPEFGEGVVARLWGGASPWDEEDANGSYP